MSEADDKPIAFAVHSKTWQYGPLTVQEHEYVGDPPNLPRFTCQCNVPQIAVTPQGQPIPYARVVPIKADTPLEAIQWVKDNLKKLEADTVAEGLAAYQAHQRKVKIANPNDMQKIAHMQKVGMA